MDLLFASHTLGHNLLVLAGLAHGAGGRGSPHKMERAAVAGSVRALGRQSDGAGLVLLHVTAHGDHSTAAALTGRGRTMGKDR